MIIYAFEVQEKDGKILELVQFPGGNPTMHRFLTGGPFRELALLLGFKGPQVVQWEV